MIATEKLDGSNLWCGLDSEGKLYTTRAGKKSHAKKMYSADDYPQISTVDPFRAAHAALKAKEDEIKSVMQPGQEVEVEVLFGRQPNAITYGKDGLNYIAFLRGVEGTPDVVADQLASRLGHSTVQVEVSLTDTSDGENLTTTKTQVTFKFTVSQRVSQADLKHVNVEPLISALESYLKEKVDLEGFDLTNFDLMTRSLGSFPMDIRPEAKTLKEEVLAKVMSDFKLPIKKELLDKFVSKVKPALGAADTSHDEDIGVEGVVLRDPATGEQVKIVDKDTFTTLNQFNQAVRASISGVVKTLDQEAPIESRGGVIGELKIKIADLLGNKELARGAGARKALDSVKGADEVDTVKKFAAQLQVEDFQGAKRKILAMISATHSKLGAMLADFKENKDHFHLKLKDGRSIGLSEGTVKKTLLSFAEGRKDLTELFERVKSTKTIAQLIAVLYGRNVKVVHSVNESILQEKRYDTDKARYQGKDAWTLLNTYLATLFMSAVIYQANDVRGMKLLKDKAHFRMSGWSKEMSQLNFWGYPIWKSSQPAVKKLIGNKTAAAIFKITRRIPVNNVLALHMDLSFGKDVPIEWHDHYKTLKVLQQFEGLNIDRINTLMTGTFNYSNLTHDEKVKFLTKLSFYVQQFVAQSPLALRIKAIYHELIMNANGENDQMIQELKLLGQINQLVEDAPEGATSAVDIAPVPGGKPGRRIVKMIRNPDVKRRKFERPVAEKEDSK